MATTQDPAPPNNGNLRVASVSAPPRKSRFPEWLLRHARPVALGMTLLVLLAPMFAGGMWDGHDAIPHMLRLQSTLSALQEGQVPPVINSAQENAFGYSWNLFYPPLTIHLAAGATLGLKALGVTSPFAGMKLAWFCIVLGAAASMYFFVHRVFRSRFAAALGTILYVTAPYFVSCVYIRFALGESTLFVFLPVAAAGLYSIFYEQGERNYLVTAGTAGIILSNIPSSIMLLLCLTVFSILHAPYFRNARILRQLGANIVLTCGLAAFFYIPLLEQWQRHSVTAFSAMYGATLAWLEKESVEFWWLIFPHRVADMLFYFGFPILFCAAWLFFRTPQTRHTKIAALLCLLLSVAMSKWMPWAAIIPPALDVIKYLQFPWRMLGVTLFLLCTLAARNSLLFFARETQPKALLAITAWCVAGALFLVHGKTYRHPLPPETHTNDYLPRNSLPFKEAFASMKAEPVVISGEGVLRNQKKRGSRLSFSYDGSAGQTVVELPYFAYLGYTASLKTEDGRTLALPLDESGKGLWSITLPAAARGEVSAAYAGTPASRVSYRVSQGALVLFACYIVWQTRLHARRKDPREEKP